MKEKHAQSDLLVAGGRQNVLRKNPDKIRIRTEVRERYAEQLAQAGFVRRIMLRYKIHREITKEIKRLAPPGALYVRNTGNDR